VSYEIIKIVFTDDDVRSIAEEAGIDVDVALNRAEDWAKALTETATGGINEQLYSVIVNDQP